MDGRGGAAAGLTLATASSLLLTSPSHQNQPMNSDHHRSGVGFKDAHVEEASTTPPRENRAVVISEMDFFSNEKKKMTMTSGAAPELDLKVPSLCIKREDLSVNTGLHLSNTRSDLSTVDDGMSPPEDDKEGKSELTAVQAELARMNQENNKLRLMLNQLTTNYNALQMQLVALTQQRRTSGNPQEPENRKMEEKSHDKHDGAVVPRRQFMDLGPGGDIDEPSHSSSTSRDPCLSLRSHTEVSLDHEKHVREDDRAEHGWNSNKTPRLAPSKSAERAEDATMRKARVSVRARSEAPTVDHRWMPVEEVWTEDGQRKPLPSGLLPMHHGHRVSGPQAGTEVRRRPFDLDHNVRGHSQPSAPAGSHTDGVDHFRRGVDARIGVDAERRRADEFQLPCKNRSPLLVEHGEHISLGAVPHRDVGPHPKSQPSAVPIAIPERRSAAAAGLWAAATEPVQILGPSDVTGDGSRPNGAPKGPVRRATFSGRYSERGHNGGPQLHRSGCGGHIFDHRRRRQSSNRKR
ncbi:uncharacterized protein LOC135675950 isoform X2 [Musa acuminata AAA Group]|uniref:uncharacterized protein LOC135675950 isoform X2 n=1 Tax=Musa acuminata AAA Group TaxID=214697 RepID=UPI0031DF82BB